MSEEEQQAPTPNPTTPFLEPEEKGLSKFLLPGALAVGGAALLYKAFKSKKKNGSKAPKATSEEVKFGKNYAKYTVGNEWVDTVLDPYLSDQAEEENLITASYFQDHPHDEATARTLVSSSRKLVLKAFQNTHEAIAPDEKGVLFSKLPQDKSGVQHFNKWLAEQTQAFQERY